MIRLRAKPVFSVEPMVWVTVEGPTEFMGRFRTWCHEQGIRPAHPGGGHPGRDSDGYTAEDAEKIAAWLRENRARPVR